MKQNISKIVFFVLLIPILTMLGCEKEWLTAKRDLNTVLPKTLDDLTAMLHADLTLSLANDYAGAQLARDDDHYTPQTLLISYNELNRMLYTWDVNVFSAVSSTSEWNSSYEQILYANVVLETLNSIERTWQNAEKWDNVCGAALFFRAKSHYNVARQFALPYLPSMGTEDGLGIPLRLDSDPNIPSERASLSETYDRILTDLKEASSLLSTQVPYLITPSKQAAFGLLARVNLSICEYDMAGRYADSCLRLYDTLLDYKDFRVTTDRDFPFPLLNSEVIFQSYLMPHYSVITVSGGMVDSVLFSNYSDNDLRKTLFFTSTGGFRGNYTGSNSKFSGIAVDEMLLIRAECHARAGANEMALADLNRLLDKRIAGFVPYANLGGTALLDLILIERRKQLLYRGLRWDDLRRLNVEPGRQTTVRRNLDGQELTLAPQDRRYALPIPQYIIANSNINQNEWK